MNVATDDSLFRRYCIESRLNASPKVDDDFFVRPLMETMTQQLSLFPSVGDKIHNTEFIRLGFIDKGSPNAFVDAWEGGACVCLHSGLLLSILEAAIQLQDRLGAFNERPGSSETEFDDHIGMTSYLNLLRRVDRDDSLFDAPEDREDEATWRAQNFVSSGLQFVVLHEFAHITFGHLGFLKHQGGQAKLFEFNELDIPTGMDDLETRYFFEHEADVFALETVLRSALGRQIARHSPEHTSGEEVFTIIVSYLTTVFGWITLENELGRSPASVHPLSFERLFALPMAVQGLLAENSAYEGPLGTALNRSRVLLAKTVSKYPKLANIARIFSPQTLAGIDQKIDWMRRMDEQTAARLDFRL